MRQMRQMHSLSGNLASMANGLAYTLAAQIAKNSTLGQIKWEQMVFLGNPEYGVELQPIDFAAFAHACGGVGFTVEDPADCGRAVEEFLNVPGPALLEAVVDPLEPPLPAKITAEQAVKICRVAGAGRTQPRQRLLSQRCPTKFGKWFRLWCQS
jgi:pyruvate dehydrogenase (quinone)